MYQHYCTIVEHLIYQNPIYACALNASLHGDASLLAYQPQFDFRETVLTPLLCSDLQIENDLRTFAGWNGLSIKSRIFILPLTVGSKFCELSTFAWQQAPESTLVIRHGDDHTSLFVPPGPASLAGDIARTFLRTGVMPGPRSDAQVTILGHGDTRGPIPGAYDVPTGAIAGDVSSVEDIV
ncbi:hypothetical protein GGX14DRAFT_389723 [Mycena pura]|uniref:Uncharacterized protein n=1 Tax=Mycena pura TaxID=153505 RepID=A0AAD6YHJ0_9AGAR|nr:hypothetical protein GGX14DRAFT_389723 [Mycena pura]